MPASDDGRAQGSAFGSGVAPTGMCGGMTPVDRRVRGVEEAAAATLGGQLGGECALVDHAVPGGLGEEVHHVAVAVRPGDVERAAAAAVASGCLRPVHRSSVGVADSVVACELSKV